MSNRRDRHQRGLRGPLSLPNPYTHSAVRFPQPERSRQYFISCIQRSIASIMRTCPQSLSFVDVGVEDIPWLGFNFTHVDHVPLAAAIDATSSRPARIVIFRRPLERRAQNRNDLAEQLAALTNRLPHDIDPDYEDSAS